MSETETFQHYQVLRREDGSLWELGRGAMGVTYKAFDVNLRCHVALKVINGQFLDSEMARARFLREARAAAGLRHRNVASVYHLGDDAESFFYSMEFIDGQTVEAMVRAQGPLPATLALQITRQVARALGAAAKQGVVHRDIKPANLMVVREDDEEDEEGFVVKVIDFGLARSALAGGEQSGHITMGGFVGTPQYASPEQIEEKELDARSDIYSLGVTLWYMLAGQPPFTGTVFHISSQHLSKDPPWAAIEASVAEPVRSLLGRMLQKDPEARPQTPGKLRVEIEECLRQLPTAPGVATPATPEPDAPLPADTALPEEDTSANVTIIQGPAPTVGRIFAGRYQLAALANEGTSGRTFRAYDGRLDGKLVALKVLNPELHLSPQAFYHLQGDLARLRDAPHPQLIETYRLERVHGYKYCVMEWVNGYPLACLLKSRGPLPLNDALRLLGQAADATAHGSAHRLHRLDLGAQKVLLNFADLGEEQDPPAPETLADRPLDAWPRFCLKINALNPARDASRSTSRDSGQGTPRISGRDTATSIRGLVEGSSYYALGGLLHEMLGVAPPEMGASADLPPIGALNEESNAVLRQAFSANPGFANENDWFHHLLQACGLRREDVGLLRTATGESAPRTATPPTTEQRAETASNAVTRAPVETPRPAAARIPVPPAPPPARPSPAPAARSEERTLTNDRAETLVPRARVTLPQGAAPAVARSVPAPAPTPPVRPPSAPPPHGRSPAPEAATPPPALPTEKTPKQAPPTVAGKNDTDASASETPAIPEAATLVPPPLAEAATYVPVESPAVLSPPPTVPANPTPATLRRVDAKRFPLLPILAGAGLLIIGGLAAILLPRSKVDRPTSHQDRTEATPRPAEPIHPPTETPAASAPAAPSETPAAPATPVVASTPPPPATPTASVQEAPVIMEPVPEETPAPTPRVEAMTPTPPPATPVPTSTPRAEKVVSPPPPTPRPNRPPPTPPKVNNLGKSPPKPKATPAKSKPTPPRNDEDVPAFLR